MKKYILTSILPNGLIGISNHKKKLVTPPTIPIIVAIVNINIYFLFTSLRCKRWKENNKIITEDKKVIAQRDKKIGKISVPFGQKTKDNSGTTSTTNPFITKIKKIT